MRSDAQSGNGIWTTFSPAHLARSQAFNHLTRARKVIEGLGTRLPPTHSCRQGHNDDVAWLTLMLQTTVSARAWTVNKSVNYHNAWIMDCKIVSF